jgi:HEAT repeat protein
LLQSFETWQSSVSLAAMFGNMSFLRSSSPLDEMLNQSYHFIHLTFQEYFAAKYFVQKWQAGKNIECIDLESNNYRCLTMSCEAFIQQHKYDSRYHIMWSFVTGLMNDDGEDKNVERFLQAIEQEPVDLLGPAHQRLIVQCLSQAVSLPVVPIRSRWEQRLKRWILFELDLFGHSALVSESNFPASILDDTFQSCCDDGRKIDLLRSLEYTANNISETTLMAVAKTKAQNPELRGATVQALGRQSNLSDSTVAALTGLLSDGDPRVRSSAITAIRGHSNLSDSTAVTLVGLLSDEDPRVRSSAITAIRGQSNLSDSTVAALTGLLSDEDSGVRWAAITAIRGHSNLSDSTAAALTGLLSDEDSGVRWAAITAIRGQSNLSDSTVAALTGLLSDEDSGVRWAAITAIRGQSNLSDSTAAALTGLLSDEDPRVQRSAIDAIRGQSNLSNSTVAALTGLLSDGDSRVRRAAINAVGGQSNLSDLTVAALTELISSNDWQVELTAVRATGKQSNLLDSSLVGLEELSRGENDNARLVAIEAKGEQSSLLESNSMLLAVLFADQDTHASDGILNTLVSTPDFVERLFGVIGFLPVLTCSAQPPRPVLFQAMEYLYRILFQISFRKQLSFYHKGDYCYVNQPSGLLVATLGNGQRANLEDAVSRGRKYLGHSCEHRLW